MRLVLRAVVLFFAVLFGLVGSSNALLSQVVNSSAITKEVEFAAEDGVLLKGIFAIPVDGPQQRPTVILVHELGGDRKQWAPFMGVFHQQGYAVLSYDLRGQGESTTNYQIPINDLKYQLDLVKDVGAALKFALAQPEVDPQRIALVGVGFSANTAWASMGIYPEFKAAAAISIRFSHLQPVYPFKFAPRAVAFFTDIIDKPGTLYFAEQTAEPKQVYVYAFELNHEFGFDLLINAKPTQDLFAWLRRHLRSF
jgi:pimeloyl-ACP methyl ester carboxylesterase